MWYLTVSIPDLCTLTYFDTSTQNGDVASPSIIPAGRGQLMKMFITLEPHGTCTLYIVIKFCFLIHFNIVCNWFAKLRPNFAEKFDHCPRLPNNCLRIPIISPTIAPASPIYVHHGSCILRSVDYLWDCIPPFIFNTFYAAYFRIAPLSDIRMFYIRYLTMHKVHIHAGAINQLVYGCAHVREIIHSLKLMDYPPYIRTNHTIT